MWQISVRHNNSRMDFLQIFKALIKIKQKVNAYMTDNENREFSNAYYEGIVFGIVVGLIVASGTY